MPRIRELAGAGRFGYCVDSQGSIHGAPRADVLGYVAQCYRARDLILWA